MLIMMIKIIVEPGGNAFDAWCCISSPYSNRLLTGWKILGKARWKNNNTNRELFEAPDEFGSATRV